MGSPPRVPDPFPTDAAETAAREAMEAFRVLAETTRTAVCVLQGERLVFANRSLLQLTGYAWKELQEMKFWELGHAEDREFLRDRGLARQRGEDVPKRYEVRLLAKDGGTRRVEFSADRILLDGRPAVAATLQDVTETAALTRRLAQAQKLEAVGRLAGGIAHDFNNLLTVILGYGEELADRLRGQGEAEALHREVQAAAGRAADLTRQLLAFGRRQELRPEPLDLNRTVAAMEGMLRRIIGERIELLFTPSEEPLRILADRSQVEQVVMNVVVNARDAMPRGGVVWMATAPCEVAEDGKAGAAPGRYAALSVADTGLGMAPEVLSRALEPFFTTKRQGEGTGLGLSTVYGIVEQSGGFLRLESGEGKGTKVTAAFPLAPEGAPRAAPQEARPVPRAGDGRILVVEDDPALRRSLEATLRAAGWEVTPAGDGEAALERLRPLPADLRLLVTDVVLPGMGGRELARRALLLCPDLPVLLISGYPDSASPGEDPPGRTGFLAKPFSRDALVSKVRVLTAR